MSESMDPPTLAPPKIDPPSGGNRGVIGEVPTVQHPPHADLADLFNSDKMATFLVENKAEVCSLLIGGLVDRLKEAGFTEADLIRGIAAHCRHRQFPKAVEFNLLDAASKFDA